MKTIYPRTWGESDSALFPVELRAVLQRINRAVFILNPVEKKTKTKHTFSIIWLANNFRWRSLITSSELLQIIRGLTTQLKADEHERWLDFPILPNLRNGSICDSSRLALLRSTHLILQEKAIRSDELNSLLQFETFFTLLNKTNDLVCSLDILMTARSFFDHLPLPPDPQTLDELLNLMTHRILLEHGVPVDLKQFENVRKVVGLRLGLHEEGKQTLQTISEKLGVTRERVRQIFQKWMNSDMELDRIWPPPPIFRSLIDQLSKSEIWDNQQLQVLLASEFNTDWKNPCTTIAALLSKIETDLPLVLVNQNTLASPNYLEDRSQLPSQSVIRRSILHCGAKSCFALIEDVLEALTAKFPDIPRDDLRLLIRANAVYGNLPMDYVFASGREDQISPVSRALLMLAWSGELSVEAIRTGLDRYGRFRQMPPPPPVEVLKAFYEHRPEFEIHGDVVRATIPTDRNEETIEGQIALLCEQQDGAVIPKSLIYDHFRQLGRYTSSMSMYVTYSPILRPAGTGCMTIVGRNPTVAQIEAAKELGKNLAINSDISWRSEPPVHIAEIFVGSAFRDSGVIGLSGPKARLLEGRRFQVLSEDSVEHGSLSVSGNFFYGFTPFLNALRIDPGDTIRVELDTTTEVALIRVNPIDFEY
jgi:hypothetical protein